MDIRKNKKGYVKEAKKNRRRKRGQSTVFAKKPKGRFISFWSQLIGFILAAIGGITFLIFGVYYGARGAFYGMESFFMLLLFLFGAVLFYRGYSTRKFHGRFRFYRRLLEGRESVSLEELSDMTNRKVSFLRKDLQTMIDQKLFLQAKLDKEEKYLFLTEEACEIQTSETCESSQSQPAPHDYRRLAEEYLAFYEMIGKRIKTKSVQRIVTDFGVYTVQILSYEIEQEDRERFLTYYLPVTKDVLLSFEEMEKEAVAKEAADLEDILNTIRYSFETFAGRLAEGKSMDVETDILALEDIWRKESC